MTGYINIPFVACIVCVSILYVVYICRNLLMNASNFTNRSSTMISLLVSLNVNPLFYAKCHGLMWWNTE